MTSSSPVGCSTLRAILCLSVWGFTAAWGQGALPREVTFPTGDGVAIHGDLHVGLHGKAGPVLLLFHQGGGEARGEYGPILPRLLREGYSILAIDQRSGGDRFGGVNRTVAALRRTGASYCDAYADLVAALHFVRHEGFVGRLIAWGSSYSASLAIRLGAEHTAEVAAVLAFSPAAGDAMGECQPDPYIARLRMPLLVLRPASEMTLDAVRSQVDVLAEHRHEIYVAENGVHGSSMLVADRVNGDVEPHWERVMAFIRAATSK